METAHDFHNKCQLQQLLQHRCQAFREFAVQATSHIAEQLSQKFEREVHAVYGDATAYRDELERVTSLLGAQVDREKKLHEVISQISQMHTLLTQRLQVDNSHWAQLLAGNAAGDLVTVANIGVSQTAKSLQARVATANQLKDEAATVE